MQKKPMSKSAFEKKDKAMDRKLGVKEDSKRDKGMDKKMMKSMSMKEKK